LLWIVVAGIAAFCPGASGKTAWFFLLAAASIALSVVAYLRIRRSTTRRMRWMWFLMALALHAAASYPAALSFGSMAAEEWCESEPGGRGYAGTKPLEAAPMICRL
jgi:cell division protein FtsW (lipid II flippase)